MLFSRLKEDCNHDTSVKPISSMTCEAQRCLNFQGLWSNLDQFHRVTPLFIIVSSREFHYNSPTIH